MIRRLKAYFEKAPEWLKNKYSITLINAFIYLLFFETKPLYSVINWRIDLIQLKKEQQFYKNEIERVEEELNDLKGNPESLEKFAREKYFMKKPNEEIFLIVEE